MKIICIIFIGLLLNSCRNPNSLEIDEIQIFKVDFEILTFGRINCNDFKSSFNSEIKKVSLKNYSQIEEFENILLSLKNDHRNYTPDVRAKILIYYNNKCDTICMDEACCVWRGKSLIVTSELVDFIEKSN